MHIAGDWGTTRLRLWLCDGKDVVASAEGPGISSLGGRPGDSVFGGTLMRCTQHWDNDYGPVPVILCGMIGSRNGWREVPYVPCPADVRALAGSLVRMTDSDRPVTIVPGVRCARRSGSVDVMRGEETQIHGGLALLPDITQGRYVFCLPGTHTKWACVEDGRIVSFLTSLSGEAFALLADHSMLLRAHPTGAADGGNEVSLSSFAEALDGLPREEDGGLLHQLFQVRSRQLILDLAPTEARALLSAIIIDHDVRGGLAALAQPSGRTERIVLIGADRISRLYALAVERRGAACDILDAEAATRQGLMSIWGAAAGAGLRGAMQCP